MTKTEAFNRLGYLYEATRGVWSAERDGAVLMTLWQREIGWLPGANGGCLYVDLDELHPIGTESRLALDSNAKLRRRVDRLKKKLDYSDISLDIVVLMGAVGNDEGKAFPWNTEEHGWSWSVLRADTNTNSFRLEAERTKAN